MGRVDVADTKLSRRYNLSLATGTVVLFTVRNKKKKKGSDHCVKSERERTEIIVPNGWAAASGRWFSDSPSLPGVFVNLPASGRPMGNHGSIIRYCYYATP